jgi:hypothetical protein
MGSLLTELGGVSPLEILVAAIVMMLVGILWYSRFLFGKAWIRHSGIRLGDIRPEDARRGHIFGIITAFISATLLGLLVGHTGKVHALFHAVFFIWIFVMLEQFNSFVWRRDPFALFLLQAFRSLFSLLAGAAVFYFWS